MAVQQEKNKMKRIACLAAVCASMLALSLGCAQKRVPLPATAEAAGRNRSYIDLQPGATVHVVAPLTNSGEFRSSFVQQKADGNTISMQARDLIGYTTSTYHVVGKNGAVRLEFVSAQHSENGNRTSLNTAPPLPFDLPHKPEHIRLIFLVRVSQADHNMAIVAAKRPETLEDFTKELNQNPRLCPAQSPVFCSWVPAGVAVRVEK